MAEWQHIITVEGIPLDAQKIEIKMQISPEGRGEWLEVGERRYWHLIDGELVEGDGPWPPPRKRR